jgi:N-acetylneuraminic acid mutarotase
MIVWGGLPVTGYLNTGGRYNPSTDSWTATSTTNAPTPRAYHTAVWTGSEMIIWGAADMFCCEDFGTGARYNPVTNSWTATSTTNAPPGRIGHTAVWTGSEMIVWGGSNGGFQTNTGGRYNPNTDSWTATSDANAPSERVYHTAVWTGSEMIVWGGIGISVFLNTDGKYNPVTNSWAATSTANAPTGRADHTAVWTGNDMIVWGGDSPFVEDTGGRYCVQSGPAPRYDFNGDGYPD